MAGPRTTLRAVAEARFGALLLDAIEGTGIERAFCDCADTRAEATLTGLAGDGVGIIAGHWAGGFSAAGADDLLGDAMSGAFPDGVEDGLITGGTSGCASSDIANGEI